MTSNDINLSAEQTVSLACDTPEGLEGKEAARLKARIAELEQDWRREAADARRVHGPARESYSQTAGVLDSCADQLHNALLAPTEAPPAPAEAELTTGQAIEQIRERMAGMGYTSPIEAALSLVTSSAHFAFMTVDRPGKWDALCHEIAAISEAGKLRAGFTLAQPEAELRAEIEYHRIEAAQYSGNTDMWYAHVSLEQVVADKLNLMRREAHWRNKLAQALASAEAGQ